MDTELEFILCETAFKRHLSEVDIRHAFQTARYMGQYGSRENAYLLPGFDTKPNPVEILCDEFFDGRYPGVNVFHAMPCRARFHHLFEEKTL